MTSTNQLGAIDHVVVLMLENRSFDHMLGFLYADRGNRSLSGQSFDGLAGTETNLDSGGKPVPISRITATTPHPYLMPGADPGEGFLATKSQLYGTATVPTNQSPTNDGFVTDFAYTLGWESKGAELACHARHHTGRHHGHVHARDVAGAVGAGPWLRGVRPMVLVGPDGDDAKPSLRLCCNEPGAHGRQDEDVHELSRFSRF